MKLVEIIRTPQTSDATYAALREVTLQMKKAPVTCKDTPGFIVNRLLVPYMCKLLRFARLGSDRPERSGRAIGDRSSRNDQKWGARSTEAD